MCFIFFLLFWIKVFKGLLFTLIFCVCFHCEMEEKISIDCLKYNFSCNLYILYIYHISCEKKKWNNFFFFINFTIYSYLLDKLRIQFVFVSFVFYFVFCSIHKLINELPFGFFFQMSHF